MTDEQLMAALQGGDRSAYIQLYQRYQQRILNFLRRRTGSQELAEEALQDTWLRVYRSCHRFDTSRRFSAWLFTIAARAGHDARGPAGEEPLTEHTTQQHTDQHLARDLVDRALRTLSEDERRLVLLSAEGFSSTEIAEMLGMKPSAVRMRISRARASLHAILGTKS